MLLSVAVVVEKPLRSVVYCDELNVVSATGVVVVFIVPDHMQRFVIQIQTMTLLHLFFSFFFLTLN